MTSWVILAVLIVVGIFDLYLYFTKQKTLSQGWLFLKLGWITEDYRPPKWVMATIMCVLLGLSWWLFGGVNTFIKVLIGVIMGHLFWND